MPLIAFIGTRDLGALPVTWVNLFARAARRFSAAGFTVRTGGASGSEQLAIAACLERGGTAKVILPYSGFEQAWVSWAQQNFAERLTVTTYDPATDGEWETAIRRWHPSGRYLSNASRATLARYYGVIAGADVVIALPYARRSDPRDRGTTGHGIEWARQLGLTLFDLSQDADRAALRTRLFELEVEIAGRKTPDLPAEQFDAGTGELTPGASALST